MGGTIALVVIVAIAGYGVMLYNRLVKNRQMVGEGWSGIDVQLKRRSNLIPNLLESVKGYMKHEKGLLEEVTRLRTGADAAAGAGPGERGKAEGLLSAALGKLMVVVENYPDLKASQNFLEFQDALEEIETEIQLSRRYYNGSARNNNIAVESFPSNLIAGQFGFSVAEYFEIENAADRAVPQVTFD